MSAEGAVVASIWKALSAGSLIGVASSSAWFWSWKKDRDKDISSLKEAVQTLENSDSLKSLEIKNIMEKLSSIEKSGTNTLEKIDEVKGLITAVMTEVRIREGVEEKLRERDK